MIVIDSYYITWWIFGLFVAGLLWVVKKIMEMRRGADRGDRTWRI